MEEIEKFPLTSLDIKASQISKLKELFPEVFTEGNKIDLERLKLTIGENVDTGKERFGMNWPGKADCFKAIQQPSSATLIPDREDSVNFDSTENLFIEGDNLEVLKLLQKSYLGKIKMIYIDPPYNTGNDFIYPDNYSESLETYLEYTGQVDSEGRKFGTNTDTDGRFHSKWMNMMYPRLFLAKNLLLEDGVIFISIDDHEVDNLKKICNEIFGEENFLANIVWQKKYGPANDAKYLSVTHENILGYAKNLESWQPYLLERTKEQLNAFQNPDNDPRGLWRASDLSARTASESTYYPIIIPSGKTVYPPSSRSWIVTNKRYNELVKDNRIWFGVDGNARPMQKKFLSEVKKGITPQTWWDRNFAGDNKIARYELKDLFPENIFDTPKPSKLIKRFGQLATKEENIILDFFSGSGTTAHAVLELNIEDSGHRKFICVQLPEPTDENSEAFKAGFKNIADIGKERIRRVIKKIEDKAKQKPDMFSEKDKKPDLGFKVLKLAKSNFSGWNSEVVKTEEAVNLQLFKHIQHIFPEAEQEAILYELLLKSGFQLTTPIKTLTFTDNTLHEKPTPSKKAVMKVYSIGENELLICPEKNLTHELIKAMAEKKPVRVICLDEGFHNNDQLKTNAALIMKSHGVLKFQTI
jgi:adenine-specific DNA-methyltransferase